jgi:hypothetical protein
MKKVYNGLKTCPAVVTKELHKIHGGTHAGRNGVAALCGGEP